MIPFDYITEWRAEAPWIDDAQVEYELDELLGTKLRALYQRKQARDLFDLDGWAAAQ